MIIKLKGVSLPASKIVVIILAAVATFFMIFTILKVWPGIWQINEEQSARSECARWASEEIPYSKDSFNSANYPILYKIYNGNWQEAKKFCGG